MTHIKVSTVIARPPEVVWAGIEDVSTHVEWMAEAREIRFHGDLRSGVGTEIECDTKIGPFTTTDVMTFVAWEPPRTMGIEHRGVVTGRGEFRLEPDGDSTRFVWEEDLRFPWWLWPGGWLLGNAVLVRVWTRNLARLKRRIESSGP